MNIHRIYTEKIQKSSHGQSVSHSVSPSLPPRRAALRKAILYTQQKRFTKFRAFPPPSRILASKNRHRLFVSLVMKRRRGNQKKRREKASMHAAERKEVGGIISNLFFLPSHLRSQLSDLSRDLSPARAMPFLYGMHAARSTDLPFVSRAP